jgi:hypothetical protein
VLEAVALWSVVGIYLDYTIARNETKGRTKKKERIA